MPNPIPSAEYLASVFGYVDGALFWKERPLCHFKNRLDKARMGEFLDFLQAAAAQQGVQWE